MRAALLGLLALLAVLLPGHSRAETLVAATSTKLVQITSNFTGTEITVFGTIERDAATISRAAPYRLAVQVFGPKETVVTRRKERTFGIWVNAASRTYVDVPSFYAVLATGPIADLSTPETLRRYQIGTRNLFMPETVDGGVDVVAGSPDFREAFVRLKERAGLYRELPGGVEFLTPTLFRAAVPIPTNVPTGHYRVAIVLLQEGVPLAEHVSDLVVVKSGFESWTYDLAFAWPALYGIATVLMALGTGWIAGILFRRD